MTSTQMDHSDNETPKPRGRLILIGIFAIAIVPVVLATFMYFNSFMVPSGRTNNGALMLPPLNFDQLGLVSQQGEPLRIEDISEKWSLLIISGGACDELCQKALYKARQVNIALHREADRVIRYYVDASNDGQGKLDTKMREDHPHLNQAKAERFKLKQYLDQKMDGNVALNQSYILVMDPLGNVMMFYTPENSGKDMLKDLKRLLKVSQIG